MKNASRKIVLLAVLMSVVSIALLMFFAGCNKQETPTVSKETVTDQNGETVTDANGDPVTRTVYDETEVLTDANGNTVLDQQGNPQTTKVKIYEQTETVTDKSGKAVTDANGKPMTTKVTVDEKGSTVAPKATTKPNDDAEVGEDLGEVVSSPSAPTPERIPYDPSAIQAGSASAKAGDLRPTELSGEQTR